MATKTTQLVGMLKHSFPHLSPDRIVYLASKVTTKLMRLKLEGCTYELSATPFAPKFDRYYTHIEIVVDSTTIYLRITIS